MFSQSATLENVVLPKNIKTIGDFALYYCDISDIVIPEGVEDCSEMFTDCKNLKTAPTIPKGVEYCSHMFSNCENLKVAPEIPEGIKDCTYMFYNCINLEILPEVPETVKNTEGMFAGCKKAFETLLHEMFT